MIEFTQGKFTRSSHVTVRASHHMTVAQVLAFADKLREVGIPLDTQVYHNTAYDTGHFNFMSARWTEVQEP